MPRKQSSAFQHHEMTLKEVELLEASQTDPNLFFAYWFKKPDVEQPFQLDHNFDEEGKWQLDFCLAEQTFIVAVCGIATGKTLTVGLSACYHAVLNQDFKFLNIGYELRQAEYMYDAIIEFSRGTRFEKLIAKKPRSPNPQIVIEFKIGSVIRRATLQFMSAGENNDAMNVFSWRGDWINVEECGRFSNLAELVANLTTRLTGSTASGRPYMARLSMISNPHENPELWALFDQCLADEGHSLAISIDSAKNHNVTEAQLAAQLRNMSKEDQDRFLTGKRPEGRGLYFSKDLIHRAESKILGERLLRGIKEQKPGYYGEEIGHMGYYHFKMPREQGRVYLQVADPGIGNPPLRNAPAIMVFDVTDAPKYSFLTAMWWGFGRGSIQPFVLEYMNMMDMYKPIFAGVDSTSTQKNMAEIMNMDYVWGKDKSVNQITGLDFSGAKKPAYLVSLRMMMEQERLGYPDVAVGISQQLAKYDPLEDRPGLTKVKLAQDLVCTISMGSYAIYGYFGNFEPTEAEEVGTFIYPPSWDWQPSQDALRSFPRERRVDANRSSTRSGAGR